MEKYVLIVKDAVAYLKIFLNSHIRHVGALSDLQSFFHLP